MALKRYSLMKNRVKRHRRVRGKVSGTAQRPRLAVFRSARHISAQLIDDIAQRTLLSVSDRDTATLARKPKGPQASKATIAAGVGAVLAQRAREAGVQGVVFDRGGFAYHGRVKALADAARKAGLKF